MPRISVDLDLKFMPLLPRPATLRKMNSQMELISGRITKNITGAEIFKKKTRGWDNFKTLCKIEGCNSKDRT